MLLSRPLTARPAQPADRPVIQTLVRYEERVHTHLDWKPVEDWLGSQPFLVAERGSRIVGALALPPDLPDTVWLRLLVAADGVAAGAIWDLLWPLARAALRAQGLTQVAALSLEPWTEALYAAGGLQKLHDVVVLNRPFDAVLPARRPLPEGVQLRLAEPGEYEALSAADTAAFLPPWQLSTAMVRLAAAQAECLGVAEHAGNVIGYQLTTPSRAGAHLARLAVRPEWQGRGLGQALVVQLIDFYNRRGGREITVNTQNDNRSSLAVYQRLGFHLTETRFPVYQCAL